MHSPTQPLITSAPPQILLIDNHDSFTHLLGDLIWRAVGISPTILPNNSPDLTASTLDNADLIVISPGPGHPGVAEDIGASTLAVQQDTTPVIGVCLGVSGHCTGSGRSGRAGDGPDARPAQQCDPQLNRYI